MSVATDMDDALALLVTAYKAACANPKPNYSIGGQSVSHADYLRSLSDSIKATGELQGILDPYLIVTNMG